MFFLLFLGPSPRQCPALTTAVGLVLSVVVAACGVALYNHQTLKTIPAETESKSVAAGQSEELSFVRALLQFPWSLRIKRPANDCVLQQVMLAKQASPLSLGILALKREWREGEGGGAPEGRRCNLRTWHSLQEGDSSRPDHCAKACQDHQKLQIGLPPSLKWLFRHLSSGSSASCRQAPLASCFSWPRSFKVHQHGQCLPCLRVSRIRAAVRALGGAEQSRAEQSRAERRAAERSGRAEHLRERLF